MSRVRGLVGTRKGAFILEADSRRKDGKVSGPHFAGWELYHMKGSPAHPGEARTMFPPSALLTRRPSA